MMKTGTAGTAGASVLLVWLLSALGVQIDAEAAAGIAGTLTAGVAFILHHGGFAGLWRSVVHGNKP